MGWFTQTCSFCRECVWLSLNPRVEVLRRKSIECVRTWEITSFGMPHLNSRFIPDTHLDTRFAQHGFMFLPPDRFEWLAT